MKSKINLMTHTQENLQSTTSKRKRVGILGGGFNPIHMGHLIMADQVCHQLALDNFFLMPSYESPHVDKKETIDSNERVQMLKLAVEDNPNLGIELAEINRKGKSYTYDTMKKLVEANPDTDYYFIVGGDMIEYLPKWYKIDELMKMIQFVGVERKESSKETSYPIIWVDLPLIEISSSDIRKKIASNCSAKYFLPENVLNYIHKKGLYQNGVQ